jgi:hypothetical protein
MYACVYLGVRGADSVLENRGRFLLFQFVGAIALNTYIDDRIAQRDSQAEQAGNQ